ncbi:MAG: hypothetical protein ACLQDV_15115 [Candidatus Binataceae bacterium]
MEDEDKLTLLVLNKMQGTLSARLKREYRVERVRNGNPETVNVEIFDKGEDANPEARFYCVATVGRAREKSNSCSEIRSAIALAFLGLDSQAR